MDVSALLLECSGQCAQLSRRVDDARLASALLQVSRRLLATAANEAESVSDDGQEQRSLLPPARSRQSPSADPRPDDDRSKRVSGQEVFVVGLDLETRKTLTTALQEHGFGVICFADEAALLSLSRIRIPACILLEVGPEKSGMETLKRLRADGYPAPMLAISAHGTIALAVEAIKNGASDFVRKPVNGSEVVAQIQAAIGEASQARDRAAAGALPPQGPGVVPLTRREREVLARIAVGESSKEIARRFSVSVRTVEGHRSNIMKKLGAKNAVDAIRRAFGDRPDS